jgi:crotonobetainyl-CoA:carnitine CoA-transferase CaiB-like acyl-CoA transferase
LLQATISFVGETAAGYLRTGVVPDRAARVKNAHAFAFVTKDKLPLAIHCSVPEKFWLALLKSVKRMDLADDERFKDRDRRRQNYAALERELAAVFATRAREEWLKDLEANDVPAAPIYNIAEALDDAQVKHLGLLEEVEHPKAGKMKLVGPPICYDQISRVKSAPPPLVGEQSAAILGELGYGRTAIDELDAQGITKIAQT